jgi:hypothetical protein
MCWLRVPLVVVTAVGDFKREGPHVLAACALAVGTTFCCDAPLAVVTCSWLW